MWTAPAGAKLTVDTPVTLTYDNGAGLVFSRKISIDQNYMLTITDTRRQQRRAPVDPDALRPDHPRRRAEGDRLLHPA